MKKKKAEKKYIYTNEITCDRINKWIKINKYFSVNRKIMYNQNNQINLIYYLIYIKIY